MKYIIIDEVYPVVFPNSLTHADVAINLKKIGPVTSAGFVKDVGGDTIVYGRSESLGLLPAFGDDEILDFFLKGENNN